MLHVFSDTPAASHLSVLTILLANLPLSSHMPQVTIQQHTPSLLPERLLWTDGEQSHGLSELNAHFRGMAHMVRKTGKEEVIYGEVWDLSVM